ncbi:MAG: Type 1 glutamine amidotransferase-like domain-containing protein [Butyrivibrio sp.]|nr:Type 1 glutamine amidotransferase-like domain-containing protein [Butyrivibrio sp.]
MTLFLTSTLGENYIGEDGERRACAVSAENSLLDNLLRSVPQNGKGVLMASDPDSHEINDSVRDIMAEAFEMSRIRLRGLTVCDGRNRGRAKELVSGADLVVLAGGHVPTENLFYEKIGLRELLRESGKTVVGISAGTMNCAETVYAAPELEGEALDPSYKRYLKGLGLTQINVLPHLQYLRTVELDGMRMVDEIALADSYTRPFYGLNDGSYILIKNKTAVIYGEAYYYKDGKESPVCRNGESIRI